MTAFANEGVGIAIAGLGNEQRTLPSEDIALRADQISPERRAKLERAIRRRAEEIVAGLKDEKLITQRAYRVYRIKLFLLNCKLFGLRLRQGFLNMLLKAARFFPH